MLKKVANLCGNAVYYQPMHNNVYENQVTNIRQHRTLSTQNLPT